MNQAGHELFDLVWEVPKIHLSGQLGLSDVGLRKICTKYVIPLTPRGFWMRKQMGKADARPKLQHPDFNPVIEFGESIEFLILAYSTNASGYHPRLGRD